MQKLTLIALLTILASCHSGSSLRYTGEQCSPVFVYVDETRKLIDADKSFCNTRQYEYSINHVGPLPGSDKVKSIEYCDRCVGEKDYASFATFAEKVRREINQADEVLE
jgi:hypothetical protein